MKQRLRQLSTEPYGMLLVTGPTGSGKTTTLYAVISEVNKGEDKIITIEDPVEYHLQGVLQIPVNEALLLVDRDLQHALEVVLDRVLDGDDLVLALVHFRDHRVERGGLAASGRAGDEQHAVGLGRELPQPLLHVLRKAQRVEGQPVKLVRERLAVEDPENRVLAVDARHHRD